jgi:hypothetical protein
MHHEHRGRDYEAALAAADRGLGLLAATRQREVRAWHLAEGFERRRERLLRKRRRQGT